MPYGFRGTAARTYLRAVENALTAAADAHNLDPFRSTVSRVAPLPELRHRSNRTTPYTPDTADSGDSSVGVGSSENIVVDSSDYDSLVSKINQAEGSIGAKIYTVANDINTLAENSFSVPLTSDEVKIIALGIRNSMSEFGSLTGNIETRINTFVSNILDIG